MALQRGPDQPQAQPCDDRPEQVIHFPAHIQPIFDRRCITCHGAQNPKAGLSLVDDITEYYSRSYEELLRKELAGPSIPEFGSWNSGKGGGNDQGSYLPPYSLGSYTSKLVSVLDTDSHNDPHRNILSDLEMMVLCRWVDSNYQFYGTYYGRHHSAHYQHQYFRREPTFEEAVDRLAPYWHE